MPKKCYLVFLMLIFSTGAYAQTHYISGVLEITLRTGPGTSHRVLEMVKTGQEVTILSTDNSDWTLVEVPSGRQGWVLTRFITAEKPLAPSLEQNSEHKERLLRQVTELRDENAKMKRQYDQATEALSESRKSLAALDRACEQFKNEASELMEIKSRLADTAAKLTEQTKRADDREETLNRLQLHQNIKWFLMGAGVLLVGFLLGLSAKKQRRKSSLL